MIRANCRERFTAADFDFVVRTLARSRIDHVSLVELLSDAETRDSVLDNPRLVDAILSNAGHLCISSHFYFYVLARHVLRDVGITDRKLCDYVASLLETFSRVNGLQAPHVSEDRGRQYVSDMLIALTPRDLGTGISAARACRQLFALSHRHLPREHATAQPARRTRPRLL